MRALRNYGSLEEGLVVGKGKPIFERLDLDKVLKAEEKKKETKNAKEDKQEKEEIDFETWSKLDIKVAQIIEAKDHPKADRLYVLSLDVDGETRQVVSGIKEYYTKEELLGKHVVLLANLKPIKLRGVESHGMLLAESRGEKVRLLEARLPSGSVIS